MRSEAVKGAEALREELGLKLEGAERDLHERALAAMAGHAIAASWAAGRALPAERSLREALALSGERGDPGA